MNAGIPDTLHPHGDTKPSFRLASFVGRWIMPRSAGLLAPWRYFLLLPPVFALWFHLRRFWWRITGAPMQQLTPRSDNLSGFVAEKALPYNLGNLWIINRARTERLMMIMRSIRGFNPKSAKMLVVGPRNEAELLLLNAYGFSMKNLTAIDLFSYTPSITLMDMHALHFPDSSFDAVYSSFVITYSDDIPKAVQETIRVARPGALIIFAFEHLRAGGLNQLGVHRLQNGPKELLHHFGEHVAEVIWCEDFEKDQRFTSSVMFRLKK